MNRTYEENKRRLAMYILAILFVLASLGLAFGVIGGMLFAHRVRIIDALSGGSIKGELRATIIIFETHNAVAKPVSQRAIKTLQPLPLAA
jgi:hypothetical protein